MLKEYGTLNMSLIPPRIAMKEGMVPSTTKVYFLVALCYNNTLFNNKYRIRELSGQNSLIPLQFYTYLF